MAPRSSGSRAAKEAFPSGTYGKYKRATSYFLNWLLRARNAGLAASNGAGKVAKQPLEEYDRIVAAIAKQPTALSPALLQLYPHALEACESAITLREHVALFLGASADAAHAFFLDRLKGWFTTLQDAYKAQQQQQQPKTKSEDVPVGKTDFSNYYDLLDLPDDYFVDDVFESATLQKASVKPISAAERKRLEDEAFDKDVSFELACFMMELEELSETVYAAFFDVKTEQKTLVEATVVTKIAIDCA